MKPAFQKGLYALTTVFFFSTHSYSQTNTLPSSGNVGIGTTAPSARLQVNGSARIDSTLMVRDSMIVDRDAHIRSDLQVDGNTTLEGNLTLNALRDSTLVTDEVILIDSTGNLKRGGDLKSLVYSQVPAAMPCASDMYGGYIQTAPFWQASANPQRMYLINTSCSPDPRLGVGVKPDAKLHVRLDLNPADQVLHPLIIDKKMSNVPGVEPYKLLQLNADGTLLSRKVRVDMVNWADYVFSDEYKLMSLDSLEQFIICNNHLPGIPATNDVIEEGIDLGEMNRLLLQKVEELTLYILQEKQKNKQLEERLKKLEEKLTK